MKIGLAQGSPCAILVKACSVMENSSHQVCLKGSMLLKVPLAVRSSSQFRKPNVHSSWELSPLLTPPANELYLPAVWLPKNL